VSDSPHLFGGDLLRGLGRSRRRADKAFDDVASAAAHADGVFQHALADRRRALGLSQRSAAHAAGYSRSEVSELERGTRRCAEALRRYAAVLERLEDDSRWRRTGLAGAAGANSAPQPKARAGEPS